MSFIFDHIYIYIYILDNEESLQDDDSENEYFDDDAGHGQFVNVPQHVGSLDLYLFMLYTCTVDRHPK